MHLPGLFFLICFGFVHGNLLGGMVVHPNVRHTAEAQSNLNKQFGQSSQDDSSSNLAQVHSRPALLSGIGGITPHMVVERPISEDTESTFQICATNSDCAYCNDVRSAQCPGGICKTCTDAECRSGGCYWAVNPNTDEPMFGTGHPQMCRQVTTNYPCPANILVPEKNGVLKSSKDQPITPSFPGNAKTDGENLEPAEVDGQQETPFSYTIHDSDVATVDATPGDGETDLRNDSTGDPIDDVDAENPAVPPLPFVSKGEGLGESADGRNSEDAVDADTALQIASITADKAEGPEAVSLAAAVDESGSLRGPGATGGLGEDDGARADAFSAVSDGGLPMEGVPQSTTTGVLPAAQEVSPEAGAGDGLQPDDAGDSDVPEEVEDRPEDSDSRNSKEDGGSESHEGGQATESLEPGSAAGEGAVATTEAKQVEDPVGGDVRSEDGQVVGDGPSDIVSEQRREVVIDGEDDGRRGSGRRDDDVPLPRQRGAAAGDSGDHEAGSDLAEPRLIGLQASVRTRPFPRSLSEVFFFGRGGCQYALRLQLCAATAL